MAIITNHILLDVIGVVTAILAIFVAYFKWKFQHWKTRNVPYFTPSIPFGNIPNPLQQSIHLGIHVRSTYKNMKLKGNRHYGYYIMAMPNYVPIDLELVKHILTKDFNHFVDRGFYTNERDEPISCHLFSIGGTKWKNLRSKLTPTFTSGKMKAMFQTLVDVGLIFEKYMETVDSKEAIDIKDVLGRFSTDIIGSCAFGLNCNSFEEPNSPFRRYGQKIFFETKMQALKNIFAFNFQDFARAIGMRLVPKDVSEFFHRVVEDAVRYRQENNVVRKDFLQLLIDLSNNIEGQDNGYKGDGKSLTLDEMVAQSFVFFIAGFETSSTTMTFALYELATHPEIQDKVRKEIHEILGKFNNKITYDSLNELKFMGQVIDETLRKYPPLPIITRACVEDYRVPGEDLILKKGARVIIPIMGIHYDEEYYKNPEVFDPERFNDENRKSRPQCAYLPFGEGPRTCIGLRFGVMQTKVGLTSLLRNFRVKLNPKTKIPIKMSPSSFVLSTEGGMWLNIEKI